jgi:hypothetical protein
MSKKIMWGVYGPSSKIPYGFFHSKGKATLGGAMLWNIRKMEVRRVVVQLKSKTYYDVYQHSVKLI